MACGGRAAGLAWRSDFVQTFLEQDIPKLGITITAGCRTYNSSAPLMRKYHAQLQPRDHSDQSDAAG